jgi:PAS domain S-box-containing protein
MSQSPKLRRRILWLSVAAAALSIACGCSFAHAAGGAGASASAKLLLPGILVLGVASATLAGFTVRSLLRRERSREAEAARKHYQDIVTALGDGLLALDARRRVAFATPQGARLFGCEPAELLGQTFDDIVTPRSVVAGQPPPPPSDGAGPVMRVRRRDGSELLVEVRTGPGLPGPRGETLEAVVLRDVTKSRQTSEMLCAREAHLRLIVEQMPAILWTTDKQLHITSTLGAGLAALKVRPEELIGVSMLECLDRDDLTSTPIAAHLKAVRGGSLSYEMGWKGRTFQVRVDPLCNAEKRIIGTVGILVDVTDHKNTVAELESRAKQQAAVAALGLRALSGVDLEKLMNEAIAAVRRTLDAEFCKVLEHVPEEQGFRLSAGAGWSDSGRGASPGVGMESQAGYTLRTRGAVIVEDLRTESRFPTSELLAHGARSGLSTVIRGEGGLHGVLAAHTASKRLFSADDVHFLQAVANIVAVGIERRRAEEARSRLVAILEATPDLVAVAGRDLRLSYLNKAGRDMLGLPPGEEASRFTLGEFYTPEVRDSVLADGVRAAIGRGVWGAETTLLGRAGAVPVSQVMISHRSPGGAVQFLSTIARDISERQRLEEQFRQSQKMEAVGKLAGGVAHDFNNLLCVIMGFSAMLVRGLPEDGPLRSYAREIERAAGRATTLTRQLLAFSRKQMLEPRPLDFNALLADAQMMLRRLIGEDVELVTKYAPDLLPVRADPGQIEQVLLNLAVNSRDAMPGGGTLTISTANVVLDQRGGAFSGPGAAETPPGRYALLEVTDTGCGMSEAVKARAFEPFFTTKAVGKGTGLGLSTVYGIVKQSGGHIELTSVPGRGTSFRIYLPQQDKAPEAVLPQERLAPGGKETILLVEDEDGVRKLARRVLEDKGYRVIAAADGEEALAACERHAGAIDLLLTDAVMPRLGGGELARRVRAMRPGVKVLFMSGFTDSALVRQGVASGQVDCLVKPYSPNDLAQAVREALDRPTAPPPPK